MTTLEALLRQARSAPPATRISLRDPIAAHGRDAIEPMSTWLTDPQLGAFAVRVLLRIAVDGALTSAVMNALRRPVREALAPPVASDIGNALNTLRPKPIARTSGGTRGGTAAGRAIGRLAGTTNEERFHNEMLEIYWLAGESTGYWASYFLRAVRAKGGLTTAHDLLRKTGTSPGFARLIEERKLDLSVEALVLRPDFRSLFSAHELQLAEARLEEAGYTVDQDKERS